MVQVEKRLITIVLLVNIRIHSPVFLWVTGGMPT